MTGFAGLGFMKSKDTISQIDLRATETRQFSLGDSACVPQSQQSTPPTLTPCLLAEYIVLRLFDESLTHIALLIRTPEKGSFCYANSRSQRRRSETFIADSRRIHAASRDKPILLSQPDHCDPLQEFRRTTSAPVRPRTSCDQVSKV